MTTITSAEASRGFHSRVCRIGITGENNVSPDLSVTWASNQDTHGQNQIYGRQITHGMLLAESKIRMHYYRLSRGPAPDLLLFTIPSSYLVSAPQFKLSTRCRRTIPTLGIYAIHYWAHLGAGIGFRRLAGRASAARAPFCCSSSGSRFPSTS